MREFLDELSITLWCFTIVLIVVIFSVIYVVDPHAFVESFNMVKNYFNNNPGSLQRVLTVVIGLAMFLIIGIAARFLTVATGGKRYY